ncbi:MAG: mreD [Parachlamydiales bacterium]|nr:mreD [Parachlamydiales bacterium]
MKNPIIWIGFILASVMAVMQSALFSHFFILAYAPFIALSCMHTSMLQSLWLAAGAGFCTDLLSTDPMGIHTLTYTLVCALLHRFRLGVFKDQPLQLCFYTALISLAAMPMLMILLFLFDSHLPVHGKSILLDLIKMPLVDAAYAFFWFVGPLLGWEWGFKQWKRWRLIKNG